MRDQGYEGALHKRARGCVEEALHKRALWGVPRVCGYWVPARSSPRPRKDPPPPPALSRLCVWGEGGGVRPGSDQSEACLEQAHVLHRPQCRQVRMGHI